MGQVLLFAAATSASLAIGGAVGAWSRVPGRVVGIMLAFASGALITALVLDLFGEAVDQGGALRATAAMLAGAVTFMAVDTWLDRRLVGGSADQQQVAQAGGQRIGWALLAAVTLDGVPENLALGISAVDGGGSMALLVAIVASNLPEAVAGATTMQEGGQSAPASFGVWAAAAALLGLTIVAGYAGLQGAGESTLAWLNAFAGGAVLAALADTLMPQAYSKGQPWNALATTAGFAMSFLLSG